MMSFPKNYRYLPILVLTLTTLRPAAAQFGVGLAGNPNVPKSATTAKPPAIPDMGPLTKHRDVRKNYYGEGGQAYWLFEPALPVPTTAPVVVFNHGWSATNPQIYGAWIDYIVKRGNIVIYPRYQADLTTPSTEWTDNALVAINAALERLQTEAGHVKPDLSRFVVVGHSVGGVLSANVAAQAAQHGLPRVCAVMSVMPGITWSLPQISIPLSDLKAIPPETRLLVVAGESDNFVRDVDAKNIFNTSTQVPLVNKDYVVLPTDTHGTPALVADHLAPCGDDDDYDDGEEALLEARAKGLPPTPRSQPSKERRPRSFASRSLDILDIGLWRLFDALCTATFEGKITGLDLNKQPELKSLGTWSDGTPVKALTITDKP